MAITLAGLLRRGYFPKELPPPFTTRTFANQAEMGFPPSFDLLLTRPTRANPAYISSPAIHNLARAGTLRRKLSIPNPVNQLQIAKQIVDGWQEIEAHCSKSAVSLTIPKYFDGEDSRAIAATHSFNQIPLAKARTRAGYRFVLTTDLNSFYPSIYTHSIPWALHTKSVAKAKRTDYTLLGNRLDLALRNSQAQQTIGVPIGPDTSLVVAEILATAVDLALPPNIQKRAFRYVDDFECGFMSSSDAENALAELQNAYAAYELGLNPRKTKVTQLPSALESYWVPHLRIFPVRAGHQRTDVLGLFGRAFELAREHREEAILKYAIQRMRSTTIRMENWELYEDLLLGCLSVESGTTQAVVRELCRYKKTHPLRRERIEESFNRLIEFHAQQHHGSEVAWSVWFLTHAGYEIEQAVASAALKVPDPVVGLCLLHARSKGKVAAGVGWEGLEKLMTPEELMGSNWLLAYEAGVKGWLPSYGTADHIAENVHFNELKNRGVTFFDEAAELSVEPVTLKHKRLVNEFVIADLIGDNDALDLDEDEDGDDFNMFGVSG